MHKATALSVFADLFLYDSVLLWNPRRLLWKHLLCVMDLISGLLSILFDLVYEWLQVSGLWLIQLINIDMASYDPKLLSVD